MKIRLFCVAGMSTSLLVNRMKEAAAGRGEDLDFARELQANYRREKK